MYFARIVALFLLGMVLVCGVSTTAWAEFTFQNNTNKTIQLAAAFYGESYAGNSITGGYRIQGWFDIQPGRTKSFAKTPAAYYASAEKSYKWNGDGQLAFYVWPRNQFDFNNPTTEQEQANARRKGHELRGFEKIASGTQSLSLSFGGTRIVVHNKVGKTMDFNVYYVRPSNEQVAFNGWQKINPGASWTWTAPTDGAQPDFRQTINGPQRVMIGVKGSNPFDKQVKYWGFDDARERVIGLEDFTPATSSDHGNAYQYVSIHAK
jgi:hypothetical protein